MIDDPRDDESERDRLLAELQSTREALNSARAFNDLVINNVPAGIAYLDDELVYRWLNPRAEAFFAHLGWGADRVIGHDLSEVFPEAMAMHQVFVDALDCGEPITGYGQPLVRQDHDHERTTYWDFTCVPLFECGSFAGMLVFNQEVTERVEKERLQQERISRLEELDHLKASFLNTASHELRTPLSSIIAYSEFLEDEIGGPLTEMQGEFLCQIQSGAGKLQHLVDDLIDFARMEAGQLPLYPQLTDLAELLREETARLRPQASERAITLQLDIQDDNCKAVVDPQRVGQVVQHLVDNAIKFSYPQGRVTITLTRQDGLAVVEVSDTGIGISEANLSRLFTKFSQLDYSMTRAYGGTGLGLSICKAIVLAHGGSIGVRSEEGHGSTFWFTLPVASRGETATATETWDTLGEPG